MSEYTQDGRPFRLETPLGKDVLLLVRWHGTERVSSLYQFTVEAWSTDPDIDVKKLLLQPVSLRIEMTDRGERTIGGIVKRFVNAGLMPSGLTAYHLDIVPPHWMLTIGGTFEIFQELPVPSILDKVFEGFDVKQELSDTYNKRQYCFQYRESKWAFASRLMEQEGIWYKFDHTTSPPTLVMASANSTARPEWGLSEIVANRAEDVEERLLESHVEHAPYVGKTQTRTYSEFLTQKNLREEASAVGGTGRYKAPATLVDYIFDQQLASHRQAVTPGGSDQNDDIQKLFPENTRNARIRQELQETKSLRLFGHTTHRGLASGAKMTVSRHQTASVNGAWMVLSVHHRGDNGSYIAGDGSDWDYENDFEALPFDLPYRPTRSTPWPRVAGTHVGIVVGPEGEEIYPDKYGRVHVAFRFDDDYEHDLKHSCWVRMAQVFAGPMYGSVFLPRIGHEVLVDFLDGNPDNPVIVGQLYSDHNMPPWPLPDNKTQSGFRTRSTLNGGSDEHNELRFEDKKGEEQIWKQAQKDLDTLVKNNETREVRANRTTTIVKDDTRTVKEGKDTHTIEKDDQINTVKKGNQTNEVTVGSQFVTIGKDQITKIASNQETTAEGDQMITITGDRTIEVKDGDESTTVKKGNITIKSEKGKITIEAGMAIELKCGGSTIKMGLGEITIKSPMIKIQADGMAELKSPATTVKGDGMLILKGGLTMIN
jgi:type VI secretion system secreted protein VgrG